MIDLLLEIIIQLGIVYFWIVLGCKIVKWIIHWFMD